MPLYAAPPPTPSAEPVQTIIALKSDEQASLSPGAYQVLTSAVRPSAAPQGEPVAWVTVEEDGTRHGLREWRDGTHREVPLYTSPPDHLAVMRQALEALEERHIGALRDNALDALRAALEGK
jgi:hypothetical protein